MPLKNVQYFYRIERPDELFLNSHLSQILKYTIVDDCVDYSRRWRTL